MFLTFEITIFRFSRDEKEQTIQYLNLWKNKEGKKASVEQLIAILKRLDPPQNLLADELQKFTTSELFDMQLNFKFVSTSTFEVRAGGGGGGGVKDTKLPNKWCAQSMPLFSKQEI